MIKYAIADIIERKGRYWPSVLALLFVTLRIFARSIRKSPMHGKCYRAGYACMHAYGYIHVHWPPESEMG